MPDTEEARWIRSTANELNNLLQVIAESSGALESLLMGEPAAERYLTMLHAGVERATQVTRTLAERAGGYASAETSLPQSDATKEIPDEALQFAEAQTAASGDGGYAIHNPTGSRELVMVVDDEEMITQLAAIVLAEEGYRVVTAKDGMQALEIYRELKDEISLVILDFTMPVMDGSDVFDELRALNENVSVVLSSGFTEHERLRGMLARGLRGFIPKPYTQQKLLSQIRQTLDAVQQ